MSDFGRTRWPLRLSGQSGFSLVETMIVTAVMGIVTGIAVVTISTSRQGLNGDGAMRTVLAQMNSAREQAITQRRNMLLVFSGTNTVQIVRVEVPGPTLTTLSSVPFEGGVQFLRNASLGDLPAPELPGLPATNSIAFGSATEIRFAPDGTLCDQDGLTLNGTVYTAIPGQLNSSRAITIFGSTGRIRAYRWDGRAWKVV